MTENDWTDLAAELQGIANAAVDEAVTPLDVSFHLSQAIRLTRILDVDSGDIRAESIRRLLAEMLCVSKNWIENVVEK